MTASLLIFGPRKSSVPPVQAPASQSAVLTVDAATASQAFASLLSLSISTEPGRELWIVFTMSGDTEGAAKKTGKFRVVVDGAPLLATGETFRKNRTGSASLSVRTTGLAAGTHDVVVEWARDAGPAGDLRINAQSDADEHHASLTAVEVRPQ